MTIRIHTATILGSIFLSAACGPAPTQEARFGTGTDTLVGGFPTSSRPEVGSIHMASGSACTATLIRPTVLVTAAHCVDYASTDRSGRYGTFRIDHPNFGTQSYSINGMYSVAHQGVGAADVALIRLANAVPRSVAVPTQLATRSAQSGEAVTLFGYGCTDRRGFGSFQKRRLDFGYQGTSNLCSGDSGGPFMFASDGRIFGINSGYDTFSGRDTFGLPYRYQAALQNKIAQWTNAQPPAIPPHTAPPSTPPPALSRQCLGGADKAQARPFTGQFRGDVCANTESWISTSAQPGDVLDAEITFDHREGDIDMVLFLDGGHEMARSNGAGNRETFRHAVRVSGNYYFVMFSANQSAAAVQGHFRRR